MLPLQNLVHISVPFIRVTCPLPCNPWFGHSKITWWWEQRIFPRQCIYAFCEIMKLKINYLT